MPSAEEVITLVSLYTCMCVIFSITYYFTGTAKLPIDFSLRVNEMGNISFSM